MDHFVAIDGLPAEFTIPPELHDRLSFDAKSKRLVHHGFMSKTEYDQLVARTNDWAFIRKLEDLFQMCTLEAEPRKRSWWKMFTPKQLKSAN